MKQLSLLSFISVTLIVLVPIVQNVVLLAMVVHLMAVNPKGEVNLNGSLSSSYQGWCMFVGIALFAVGVVSGFRAGIGSVQTQASGIASALAVPGNA